MLYTVVDRDLLHEVVIHKHIGLGEEMNPIISCVFSLRATVVPCMKIYPINSGYTKVPRITTVRWPE